MSNDHSQYWTIPSFDDANGSPPRRVPNRNERPLLERLHAHLHMLDLSLELEDDWAGVEFLARLRDLGAVEGLLLDSGLAPAEKERIMNWVEEEMGRQGEAERRKRG